MMSTLVLLLGSFQFRLADRMGKTEDVLANAQTNISLRPPDGMWLHVLPRVASPRSVTPFSMPRAASLHRVQCAPCCVPRAVWRLPRASMPKNHKVTSVVV
jgi:hypothetical protein